MELEALFDAVIVIPLENEETTYGSIIVPDIGKDRNEHGTVVEVAPVEIVAVVVSTIIDHNISMNFFELSWKSRIEYT